MSNLRIVHCPTSVGGNPQGLSKAEKILGLKSLNVVLENNFLNYEIDKVLFLNHVSMPLRLFKKLKLLMDLILNADVIHFNSGTTLFPVRVFVLESTKYNSLRRLYNMIAEPFVYWDAKILKFLGKKIFVTYQGSDARIYSQLPQTYEYCVSSELPEKFLSGDMDNYKLNDIKKLNFIADKVFSVNPDLMRNLRADCIFTPYAHVFVDNKEKLQRGTNEKFLIVHAPTNQAMKGSKYILEAVKNLSSKYDLDFQLVENMTNKEALLWYRKADLVIDQLFLGWYGGLAVEAMAYGTPVISYIREEDLHFIPPEMKEEMPIINASKMNIEEVIKKYLKNPQDLIPLQKKSFEYVKKWHDPLRIAKMINDLN